MINNMYEEVINPDFLRPKIKDFDEWLDIDMEGNHYKDLQSTLIAYEKAEMYEDCIIIKDKLDNYGR